MLIKADYFDQYKKEYLSNSKLDMVPFTLSSHIPVKKGKEVTKGLIKKTIIGKYKFKNMATVFSSISHLNKGYKINIDGLMGYELLSKQKTLISYKRKELMFIK